MRRDKVWFHPSAASVYAWCRRRQPNSICLCDTASMTLGCKRDYGYGSAHLRKLGRALPCMSKKTAKHITAWPFPTAATAWVCWPVTPSAS
jgi:hypothetical protein